jgi:hypothetical protein
MTESDRHEETVSHDVSMLLGMSLGGTMSFGAWFYGVPELGAVPPLIASVGAAVRLQQWKQKRGGARA